MVSTLAHIVFCEELLCEMHFPEGNGYKQVRQYKNERECNAVIQQSREEKIARMERLVDGVLPAHEFRLEEWLALQLEFEVHVVHRCLQR